MAFADDACILGNTPDMYPSARECAQCHPTIYEEWSSSAHAYSAISPMFHRFEQAINDLASGTIGAFCVRCHIPVGTSLDEPRHAPLWERSAVSVEGVTCIACHRVDEAYQKVNGERRINPGPIYDPVVGGTGAPTLEEILNNKDEYNVKDSPDGPESHTSIHKSAHKFDRITESEFCMPCHQVAVHPGIKLEVVWDQYRASPAHAQGISCQDCHMGATPGTYEDGYLTDARAIVNGKEISPGSKHADHTMVGPGYSIAHPGIYPHNVRNDPAVISIKEWMAFDWRAAWGSNDFETKIQDGSIDVEFPEFWTDPRKRAAAWAIVEENQAKLAVRYERRHAIMEIGSQVDGPWFGGEKRAGEKLTFKYKVSNLDPGHNFPSGSLGAQPEIWLNVALIDPDGNNIWESGHLDSYGDMVDLHSRDYLDGKIELDNQLFNLQTKFLTTNLKGTDREMYLPVPFDADQLPFIRPPGQPVSLLNHPPTIRMEQRSIPPLGYKWAKYSVPAKLITKPGTYRLAVRLRSRAEPMYFMSFVGATQEMMHRMNEQLMDFHAYTVEFNIQ